MIDSEPYTYEIRLKGKKSLFFAIDESEVVTFRFKTRKKMSYDDLYAFCFKLQYTYNKTLDSYFVKDYISKYDIYDIQVKTTRWKPIEDYETLEKDNEAFLARGLEENETVVEVLYSQKERNTDNDIFIERLLSLYFKDKSVSKCINLVVKKDNYDEWGFVNINQYNKKLGFIPNDRQIKSFDSLRNDAIPAIRLACFDNIRHWVANIDSVTAESAYEQYMN